MADQERISKETGEVTTIDTGALLQLNKAEIDIQIATAHKFPRSITQFQREAMQLCTLNEDIAKECIYALARTDADGERKTIEGPSVRFAEVVAHSFKNIRSGARVVNEDGQFITSQGFCHDLENNNFIAMEVQRRITTKSGRRYSADMIGVTANAASSIALRNAVLKVVPKAFWMPIYRKAREVVRGDFETLANRRGKALTEFSAYGITKEQIMAKLNVQGVADIGLDELVLLSGMITALKDGETTPEELFSDAHPQVKQPQVRKEAEQTTTADAKPQAEQKPAQQAEAQAPRKAKEQAPAKKPEPQQEFRGGDARATPNMVKQIELRIESYNVDRNKLLGFIGVEKVDEMSVTQVNQALKWIEENA